MKTVQRVVPAVMLWKPSLMTNITSGLASDVLSAILCDRARLSWVRWKQEIQDQVQDAYCILLNVDVSSLR